MLPFRNFTTENGLISNTINDLFQDSRGYLWIATFDGLSVYDGSSFKSYTSLHGLAHHLPWCVTESRRSPGTLFIGTNGGGVSQWKDGHFTTLRLGTGREENEVGDIVEDHRGSLWCLTTAGIIVVTDGVPTKLLLQPAHAHRPLAQSSDSILWVGENKTLYRFSPSRKMLSRVTVPLRGNAVINSIYADSQGGVWVSGNDSSLVLYRDTVLIFQKRISQGSPGAMLIDRQGMVWITISHKGVVRIPMSHLPRGEFEHLTTANGLPSDDITAVLTDREEHIWFGSYDKGIAELTERNLLRFTHRMPTGAGLGLDSRDRVWTVTEKEVMECWNDVTGWHTAVHNVVPPGVTIRSMTLDHADRLWCTLSNNSIRSYRIEFHTPTRASTLEHWKTLRAGIHFPNVAPFLSFVDRDSQLWYTAEPSGAGVVNLRGMPKLKKQFVHPGDIPVEAIRAMYQDRRGNLWFGGFADGLAMLPNADWRNAKMQHLTSADGLPDNGVRSITEDASGNVWVGTRYGGLAIYDGKRFQTLSARHGLLSDALWSVARGSDGKMWLGTSFGLMYVDSKNIRRMGWNQELIGAEVRRCLVDRSGRVWSVGSGALTLYDAPKHAMNTVAPPVYLTQVTINGKGAPLQNELELSYDQNNVVLQFVGVSFKRGLRYQYRLRGVEEKWSASSSSREVSYAALSPGSYTFEVIAVNGDGVPSAEPARLSFMILPPIWQRWWFVGVVGLILIAAFGGIVRYVSTQKLQRRVQELEKEQAIQLERERTRERIARDLHDDVASTLGSVVIYTESLKRQVQPEGESAELAERISALSQEAQDAIGDIVWSTAPQHDTLDELLTRMKEVFSATCTARNINYRIEFQEDFPGIRLNDVVRKNLFLIFKESLNNVVKHANATFVTLRAEYRSGVFLLKLRDNGKGFDAVANSPRGHGLRNMHKRAEEIAAQISITSRSGEGTEVDVEFRIADGV